MADLTDWCRRGKHGACTGAFRNAIGHHWWCTCSCHPTPVPPDSEAGAQAFAVYEAAKAEGVSGE